MNKRFLRTLSVCVATASVMASLTLAPTTAGAAKVTFITSSNFTVDNGYLRGVYAGSTPAHINAGVDQNGSVNLYRGTTKLGDSEKLQTGDTVKLMNGSSVAQTLSLVITGDVNGDGKLNAADLLYTQMSVLGVRELTDLNLKAAEMSNDGELTAADMAILQQYALGIGTPTVTDGFYNSDGIFYAVPVNVGKPGIARYASNDQANNIARSVWDMQTYNGKVYFGSGDYDKNQSPAYIGCYDPETDEAYIFQDKIDDEQVERFCIIDGKLVVPGIDPANNSVMHYFYLNEAENSFVNYYMNTNGRLHNFDMISYDGKIFLGGGTNSNVYASAAAVSTDGGRNFSDVGVYYNGNIVNGYTNGGWGRVYNYFVVGGELYALFYQYSTTDGGNYAGVYKYDAEANRFNYYSSVSVFDSGYSHSYYVSNKVSGFISYTFCQAAITVGDKLAICNGNLLITKDMKNYTKIEPISGIVFTDLVYANDTLYALAMVPNTDGTATNYVYKSTDLSNFTEVMRFKASTHMRSMEYVDGTFVFGAGARANDTASFDSGTIYRVKFDS